MIEIVKNLITWAKTSFTNWKYYNKIKGKKVYFTIQPFQTGFTDQLRYFHAFYTIGKHLRLKYYHIPFEPKPLIFDNSENQSEKQNSLACCKYNDIFDFMGFNDYFLKLNDVIEFSNCQQILIQLDEPQISGIGIIEFNEMESFLKKQITRSIDSKVKSAIIKIDIKNDQLLRWWIRSTFNQAFPGFNLLDIYQKFREQNPWPIKFDADKIKILIHIRQGDTAVVKTPWNAFIQVWGGKPFSFKQLNSITQINDNTVISVSDFYNFCSNLFQEFKHDELSVMLFSDGFKRSFDTLLSQSEGLNFTEKQIEELLESEKSYDQNEFKVFHAIDVVNMFVGEDSILLFDLLQSFLHSEVVIFGTQQRMIPKLIAFYFRYNNGPLAISLYRNKAQKLHHLGKEWMEKNFLFIDLDNYDIKEVAFRIKGYLAERLQQKQADQQSPSINQ